MKQVLFAILLTLLCAAPAAAQITVPFTFTSGTTIQSSQVNSDFNTLATQALNNTGGTMTGTLNTQAVAPSVDATYNLGTGALRYLNGSFSGTVTAGTVTATTFTGISGVPTGAILYFNASSCPSGWSEFVQTRGLYIVGLINGGTLGGTTGTALANLENRATGVHNHTATSSVVLNDPGHVHNIVQGFTLGGGAANGVDISTSYSFNAPEPNFVSSATTGITVTSATTTVNNSSGVAGTNAPYIQLLVCQKS